MKRLVRFLKSQRYVSPFWMWWRMVTSRNVQRLRWALAAVEPMPWVTDEMIAATIDLVRAELRAVDPENAP